MSGSDMGGEGISRSVSEQGGGRWGSEWSSFHVKCEPVVLDEVHGVLLNAHSERAMQGEV